MKNLLKIFGAVLFLALLCIGLAACDKAAPEGGEENQVPEHNHTFTEWEITDTGHRLLCTFPGCKESIYNGAHSFSEWTTVKDPTCLLEGENHRACTSCGKEETETVPTLPEHIWNSENTCTSCAAYKDSGVEFTLVDGVYTVSGYSGAESSLIIPSTYKGVAVTAIGVGAFKNNTALNSIKLPEGITEICDEAFFGCASLADVAIPESVTKIGERAFYECKAITEITVPMSVSELGSYAFYGCEGLATAEFGYDSRLTELREYTFAGCTKLGSIAIPDRVGAIGRMAFSSCRELTSVTISKSVTAIGEGAFLNCEGLTAVNYCGTPPEWTDGVTRGADWDAGTGLYTVYYSYSGYQSSGLTFELVDGTYTVTGYNGTDIFVVIPATYKGVAVTAIGERAFLYEPDLTKITLPASITKIGGSAFSVCTNLSEIKIPAAVTEIGRMAFFGCNNMRSIFVEEGNTAYMSDDGVLYTKDGGTLILYPTAKQGTDFTIPDGVTEIADYAFYLTNLTCVTIPEGVTLIGESAFKECSDLLSIAIPESVTEIGDEAFYGCYGITSLTFRDKSSLVRIGSSAFFNLGAESIIIPESVTEIGKEAFKHSDLKSIVIPVGVTKIGESAFAECKALVTVTLSPDSSLTEIETYVFSECTSLTTVILPKSITKIGSLAFLKCTKLATINYYGTKDEWGAIEKGSAWDSYAGEYTVIYECCPKETGPSHIFGDWITDEPATCTVEGLKHRICTACGKNESAAISTFEGHEWDGENTCTKCPVYKDSGVIFTLEGDTYTVTDYVGREKTVIIPSTYQGVAVTKIGDRAFFGSSTVSIKLPECITEIGNEAFGECLFLEEIALAEGNIAYKFIDGALYTADGKTLIQYVTKNTATSFRVPDGVTKIGGYAFKYCEALESVELPDTLTEIGAHAFEDCSMLKSIAIPSGVTEIGEYTFNWCVSLESIIIPESVTEIGARAFAWCQNLATVNYRGTEAEWSAITKADDWNDIAGEYTVVYSYKPE